MLGHMSGLEHWSTARIVGLRDTAHDYRGVGLQLALGRGSAFHNDRKVNILPTLKHTQG